MSPSRFALGAAGLALLATTAHADTITVSKNGPIDTIQAGVDAAAAGDTVKVTSGTYVEIVTVPVGLVGLNITGAGKVVLDARPDGATGSGPALRIQADDVTVKGLTIRHALGVGKLPGYGIGVNATGLTVQKCTFVHCDDAAIGGDTAGGATINGCTFEGGRGPAVELDGDDITVERCRIERNGGGVDIEGGSATVTKNTLDHTGGTAIDVDGAGAHISSNKITSLTSGDDDANGVDVEGDDAVIERNTLVRVSGDGIFVDGDNATIERNRIEITDNDGIDVQGAGCKVSMNRLDQLDDDGINVEGDGAMITRNRVTEANDELIQTDGAGVLIERNTLADTEDEGIQHTGDMPMILNNTIQGSYNDEGISVSGVTTDGLIDGNRISSAVRGGIRTFEEADGLTISNNRIDAVGGGDGDGIRVDGMNVEVSNNRIRGVGRDGIQVNGSGHVVRDNNVSDCLEDGIDLQGSGDHQATGNVVKDCAAEGIEIEAAECVVDDNRSTSTRSDYAQSFVPESFSGNVSSDGTDTAPPAPEIDADDLPIDD